MNDPTQIPTVTESSQASFTREINLVIERINQCINSAAEKHKTWAEYCWYETWDWESCTTHYHIPLPEKAIEYVLNLFSSYGYRIEYKKEWWQFSKHLVLYWDYSSELKLTHTIQPLEIPNNKNAILINNYMK